MLPIAAGNEEFIFLWRLGFILQFFGPLLDKNQKALPFLTRLFKTLSEDWFFGNIDAEDGFFSLLSLLFSFSFSLRFLF